jgi:hypothetical protein
LFAFSSAGTPHVINIRGEIYDDASKLVEKLYIGPGQIAQFVATDIYPKDILEYTTKCYKSGSNYINQNVGLTEGSMVWLPLNNVYVPRSTSVASI